jgi:hypothetical protein
LTPRQLGIAFLPFFDTARMNPFKELQFQNREPFFLVLRH